ncbi:MAG: MarR family transcriptional regulator [Porticoccaceae bacterium]
MSKDTKGEKVDPLKVDAITEYWLKTFDEPDPDAKRLSLKLLVVGLAICRDSEIWSKSFGLTRGEMTVLMALFRAGNTPTRPTDLLLLLSMSSAGITKNIKSLEKSGLVERRPNPLHKGGFLVSLTEAGRALAVKARTSKSWGPLTDALTKMPERMQKNAEEIFDVLINAAHSGATKRKSRAASLSYLKPHHVLEAKGLKKSLAD